MGQLLPLIFFLLFVAFFLQVDFIFYIAYVLAGVYAWSRWYTPRAFLRLQATRRYSNHAFWGENVTINVQVKNGNRLPVSWVHITESIAPNLRVGQDLNQAISLPGRGTIDLHYQVRALRRGFYRLGPLRFVSGDLFGLTKEMQGFVPPDYLTVYPRIIPLAQLGLPSHLPFGTIASTQRLFADPARPMGVREFRSGDSLRQINWKASAHKQDLLVHSFEPAISLETAVLLNLHLSDYRPTDHFYYTEWAIEAAASLAAHLINQRQPVGLLTNGRDPLLGQEDTALAFDETSGRLLGQAEDGLLLPPRIPPRNGRAHLMKILERLARLDAADTVPLAQWLPTTGLGLSWGITLLVITAQGDEATCQGLHRMVRTGFNPVLIAVEPDNAFRQVCERARQLGFVAYNITNKENLTRTF